MMRVVLQKGYVAKDRDYYGYVLPMESIEQNVDSIEEASRVVREFIDWTDIGSNQFTGGDVLDEDGNLVAWVGFNGRVWDRHYCSGAVLLYDTRTPKKV